MSYLFIFSSGISTTAFSTSQHRPRQGFLVSPSRQHHHHRKQQKQHLNRHHYQKHQKHQQHAREYCSKFSIYSFSIRTLCRSHRGGHSDDADDEKSICDNLPFRKHGYRSVPFSWEELKEIIVQQKDLARLSRSTQQEFTYQQDLIRLRQEWDSTKDFILHTKFAIPKIWDPKIGKFRAKPLPYNAMNNKKNKSLLKVVPNDYPYYCQEGIDHWIVWKLGKEKITAKEIEYAKSLIREKDKAAIDKNKMQREQQHQQPHQHHQQQQKEQQEDMIHWENPPSLKSLPEIHHIHILYRRN